MNDEDLQEIMRRVGRARRDAPPAPNERMWERIQARRMEGGPNRRTHHVRLGLLAVAASLTLLLVGASLLHRGGHRGAPERVLSATPLIERHFAQSDSIISAFEESVARGGWDTRLASQARDLELATRRIEGERQDGDSAVTSLLADVDFVLTEIAASEDITAGRDAESRIIDDSIRARQMVARLRAAATIPGARTTGEGLDP